MKTGDKVVCVDDNFGEDQEVLPEIFNEIPVKGQVYVIREVTTSAATMKPKLLLIGIVGKISRWGVEFGWMAWRFRKLDEMKEEARLRRVNTTVIGVPPAAPATQEDRAAITQP